MIIGYKDLKQYRKKVAMVDGAFDPLHHGHVEYFSRAKEVGGTLLCNIAPDSYTAVKHPPLLPAPQRAEVIDALRPIDYTHVSPVDTETVLRELQPTHYIKGKDWEGRLPPEQVRICEKEGIQIVFLDTVRDSSTQLLKTFQTGRNGKADLPAFENLVFSQQRVEATHYDQEYWTAEWRQAGNVYTIEKRREIEGRHPLVIKEVFSPTRVLDVGCGPGILMYLLHEVGVVADGVDSGARHARDGAAGSARSDHGGRRRHADIAVGRLRPGALPGSVRAHDRAGSARSGAQHLPHVARASPTRRRAFTRIRTRCWTSARRTSSTRRTSRCSTRICSGCSSCSKDSGSGRISRIGSTGWARDACSCMRSRHVGSRQ